MAVRGQRLSSSSTITSVSPTPVKTTGPPTGQIFETSGAQTLHSATARINFRWDRPVNGFVIGDTCAEFFDENDQTGFIDNFSGGEKVSNYFADLHLPLNSEGTVDVTVIANAAADTADDTRTGPQTAVTVTFAYINNH